MFNFLLILGYLALGYLFSTTKFSHQNLPDILNKFIIYISLPAMILLQTPKLNLSMDSIIPVSIAWSVMGLTAIIVFILSKQLDLSRELTGALLLVTPLGNTSFVGIPIVQAYFGVDALPYVIIYDQMGTFLALASYGTFIVSIYANTSKINLRIILYKIFTFPPFLFLLIAFALKDISYHRDVEQLLNLLASTIVPLALVAVGLQVQFKLSKDELLPFSLSLFIKLIISPLLAILICLMMGWDTESARISIMEAGMAPMITAAAMASMAGLKPRLVSSIVGFGILFSLLSTYVLHLLI